MLAMAGGSAMFLARHCPVPGFWLLLAVE